MKHIKTISIQSPKQAAAVALPDKKCKYFGKGCEPAAEEAL